MTISCIDYSAKWVCFVCSIFLFLTDGVIPLKKMSKRKAPSSENNPNHDFCEFLTGQSKLCCYIVLGREKVTYKLCMDSGSEF